MISEFSYTKLQAFINGRVNRYSSSKELLDELDIETSKLLINELFLSSHDNLLFIAELQKSTLKDKARISELEKKLEDSVQLVSKLETELKATKSAPPVTEKRKRKWLW